MLYARINMWSRILELFCLIEILFALLDVSVRSANVRGNKNCKKLKFTERINQDNHEVNSLVGSDFKFDCRVIGTPQPNVTWTKDDLPLKDLSYRSFGPGGMEKVFVLNLKNLLVADSGRYKCTADNGECKAISTSLKLIIKENSPRESPTIKYLVPINPKIKVGESVKFSCFVHKVNDFTPFIKWVRHTISKVIPTRPPAVKNNTNVTTPMPLPKTTSPTSNNLTLNVERLANIKYVVDGFLHQITDIKLEKSLQSELVISSATLEHTGKYSCVAFNEIGVDTVVSFLKVEPEPPLSKEEMERIYVEKYGSPVKLPFSLAAIVVIPVCLLIILIIGCVWWHSNEQRLEEERLKLEKQKCTDIAMIEEEKVVPRIIPIVSIQSTTSDSVDVGSNYGSQYDFVRRTKANSDAGVHTPIAVKKFQPKEPSVQSLNKKHGKSANIKESDDKAKLLVEEDQVTETDGSANDTKHDQMGNHLA